MIRKVVWRHGNRYIRASQCSVVGFLSSNPWSNPHYLHKQFTSQTATNTDRDSRFKQLEAESLSLNSNASPMQLEKAISEWESFLQTRSDSRALETMKMLYQRWKLTSRSNETDLPYKNMLHVASQVSGREALAVLQDWEVVSGNIELAIPDACFDSVIRAYATTETDSAEEGKAVALEFVQHMEQSYTSSGLPNVGTYQHVVRCICKALKENPSDQKLLKPLLETMDKLIQKIDPMQITSDQQHFNAFASALHDALEAYALILEVHETIEEPTARSHSQEWRLFWTQLLDPSCKSLWMNVPNFIATLEQTVMAILRIHQLELKTIRELAQDVGAGESCTHLVLGIETMIGTTVKILPSGRHYLRAVQTWSVLREKFAVVVEQQHALLLQRMKDQHFRYHAWPETDEEHLTATESWNNLLRANLDANLPKTTEELWDLNASSSPEYRRIRRNQESFTILLQALAAKQDSRRTDQDARRRAQKAHQILRNTLLIEEDKRIFRPTAENYASVMVAWQRSYHRDAALRCQEVFDHLLVEASLSEDMEPTKHHYNALLITWGFSKRPEATKRIMELLDTLHTRGVQIANETYSAVLFSLSRSRSKEGVDRIDQILQQLEEVAAQDTSSEVLSTACYNSLMYAQCHCNAPEIAARCDDTFQRHWNSYLQSGFQPRLQPNSTTYTTRVDAIANSSHADSIRAVSLLDEMEKLAAEGSAEAPGRTVYTAVMKAISKDKTVGPERVQAILDRMQAAYEAGNDAAKPDANAWTLLLQSWAKSRSQPNKASKTWELLECMKKMYRQGDLTMKPTPYTYSAVLNACAFTDTRDETEKFEAVRVAVTALKELGEIESGLNQYAFRNMLQVVCRHIRSPTEREKLAGRVFQRCCEEGFVESGVVRILRQNLPHLYKRLPSNDGGGVEIPVEWRRRVSDEPAVGT